MLSKNCELSYFMIALLLTWTSGVAQAVQPAVNAQVKETRLGANAAHRVAESTGSTTNKILPIADMNSLVKVLEQNGGARELLSAAHQKQFCADRPIQQGDCRLLTDDYFRDVSRDQLISESITLAKRARELDPSSEVCLFLAYLECELGHWEQGLEEVNCAIKLDPRDAKGYHLRGLILCKQRLYAASIEDLQRALTAPKRPVFEGSLRHIPYPPFGDIYRKESGERDIRFDLASAYAKLGRYDEAFDQIDFAVTEHSGLSNRGLYEGWPAILQRIKGNRASQVLLNEFLTSSEEIRPRQSLEKPGQIKALSENLEKFVAPTERQGK